jgi:hypothetical protein
MGPLTGSQGAKHLLRAHQVCPTVTTYGHKVRAPGGTHLLGRKEAAQDNPTLDALDIKVGVATFPKPNPLTNPLE